MGSLRLKDFPEDERPREKLARRGSGSLTDAELLAIFLGSGIPGSNVITVARELLEQRGGLLALSRTPPEELLERKGLGPAKVSILVAAFELGRRLAREQFAGEVLDTPEKIHALMEAEMGSLAQESVRVILLDTRRRLLKVEEVTLGTLNECLAHPREILRRAITHSSHSFVLVHNHPSGDPAPSTADRHLTRRLRDASEAVGIQLLDHVIIGRPDAGNPSGAYFSFREAGLL